MQRTIVALIDYSRSYDKVWRDALLLRMSQKSIPSHMVQWIQAWLSNRMTWMTIDGVRSQNVTLKQGLLQGSVLLPLIFLFYIDDLASVVEVPQVSLYADDVAVWMQDINLKRATSKLQKGLDAETSWSMSWKMEQPAQKSECSFLTTNTHEARLHPSVYLSRHQIKYNPNPKFLGITYNRQITCGLQMSIVGSKMKQQAGVLRYLASTDCGYEISILRSTYIAISRPTVEYAAAAWLPRVWLSMMQKL